MSRREYFRIDYPPQERPRFVWRQQALEVFDVSERGLRLARPAGARPVRGDPWVGMLHISLEEPLLLEGEVVRVDRETMALRLQPPGVPLSIVVREQQRLHRRYCQ